MERIASFCVDHTKLDRGMYLSRQSQTLMLQARFARPPSAHRTGSSSCSGVSHWAGEASLPPAPLSPTTRALRDGRTLRNVCHDGLKKCPSF